jgi:hypothetical protein
MGQKKKKRDKRNKLLEGGNRKQMTEYYYSGYKRPEEPVNNLPKIHIDYLAKQKLDGYITHCNEEISGLGRVLKDGNRLIITEIILLPQECSSSSTDLDEKELDEFLLGEIESGRSVEDLKLWWHSHVNMSAFWSGTDTGTIEKFRNGWNISIVGNKSRDYKTRLDLFEPFRYVFDDLKLDIIVPMLSDVEDVVKAEIAEKVKPRVYTNAYTNTYTPGQGWSNSWGMHRRWNTQLGKWFIVQREWDKPTQQFVEKLIPEDENKSTQAEKITTNKEDNEDLYGGYF